MKRTEPLDGCHFYCFLNGSQKFEAPISGDDTAWHWHSNWKCGWNAHGNVGWLKSLVRFFIHIWFSMVSIAGLNSQLGQLVQLLSKPCFTSFSRLLEVLTGKMKASSTYRRPPVPVPFWRSFVHNDSSGFCLSFGDRPSWTQGTPCFAAPLLFVIT